ncbi:hypothetical protein JCM10450v2_007582 [Rhodotorula kratochvilovae]
MSAFSPAWLAKERDLLLADDVDLQDSIALEKRITHYLSLLLPSYSFFARALLAAQRDYLDEQRRLLDGDSTPLRMESRRLEVERRRAAWDAARREKRDVADGGVVRRRDWAVSPTSPGGGEGGSGRRPWEMVRESKDEKVGKLREELNEKLYHLDPTGALQPIWLEMADFGHDKAPEENLFHHASLDRQEMDVYRTRYYRTKYRDARRSDPWRLARREEWAELSERRDELQRTLRKLTRPPSPAPLRLSQPLPHVPLPVRTPTRAQTDPPQREPPSPFVPQVDEKRSRTSGSIRRVLFRRRTAR